MKKYLLLLLPLLVGCEVTPQSTLKYGTAFRLNNNTFGINDFRIADSGYFAISHGSLDFGRNFYRSDDTYPDYQDSIGYIYFSGAGCGMIEYVNQDTIRQTIPFYYTWGKKDRTYQHLTIDFEDIPVRTWSRKEPLHVFEYEKIGKYWRYKTTMRKYSGEWTWAGNFLRSNVAE